MNINTRIIIKAYLMINMAFAGNCLPSDDLPTTAQAKDDRPNIVLILADDMGIDSIAALNKECRISTPNLDRLIKEGMNFSDAHSNSAVCTPTRYGILTGR